MFIIEGLKIVAYTAWSILKVFLSLFPAYQQLNGLKDQIIAAGLGVPVIVISVVGTSITLTTIFIRLARK